MTTMNKIIAIDNKQLQGHVHDIIRQMLQADWRPHYVVGITRGGLVPAVMISQYLDVPMHTLGISFRDAELGPESNLWMAEDAFGYINKEERTNEDEVSDVHRRSNILIVDDINDSGRTLQWIKDDWQSGCMPHSEAWNSVWHHNVKFACIVNNDASNFKEVDLCGLTINKQEDPSWVEFPWENWWTK